MSTTNHFSLGEIIAERVLEARRKGQSFTATVRIGKPFKSADAPDYRCPYQVAGIGDDKVRAASGEDSMQALQLAIQMLAAELHFRYKEFGFTWLGESEIGFPRPLADNAEG